MSLMNVLGFDAADLVANQRGRLSIRQQDKLVSHVLSEVADATGLGHKVERITGLLALNQDMRSGNKQHGTWLSVGEIPVLILTDGISSDDLAAAIEPAYLYTAYCVEISRQRVLLSIEEGPDWSGIITG